MRIGIPSYSFQDHNNGLEYTFNIITDARSIKYALVRVKELNSDRGFGLWEFPCNSSLEDMPFSMEFKNYLTKFIKNIAFT